MSGADNPEYPYRGIPLKPAIVQYLVRRLYGGKLVSRPVLVEEVTRAHLAEGGLKPTAERHDAIFKKALTELKDKGEAENATPGYWRILPSSSSELIVPGVADQDTELNDTNQEENGLPPTIAMESVAEVELGEGPSAVYVYYLPTYKLRAEEKGEKAWPCKVGRTDRDPLARVIGQAATALPERPHIAIILRTHRPSEWEAVLHGALTIRGMQIENLPGVEWFLTSPGEIVSSAQLIRN